MNTKLSVKQIQLALRNQFFDKRNDLIVPNVSWGLLDYEADLFVIKKSGVSTEVEIKRSIEDLRADFRKGHRHNAANSFFYCVPASIVEDAKKLLASREKEFGFVPRLLCFGEDGVVRDACFGEPFVDGRPRYDSTQKATLGRLASIRYWNLLEKTLKPENSSDKAKIRELQRELRNIKKMSAICDEEYRSLKRFLRGGHPDVLKEFNELEP